MAGLYDASFDSNKPQRDKLPEGEYKKGTIEIIYDDGNFGLTATHNRQTKTCSVPNSIMVNAIKNGHRLETRKAAEEIVKNLKTGQPLHFQLINEVAKDGNTYANCKAAKKL